MTTVIIKDIQELSCLDNKGVHNFSLGCLDCYFQLSEKIQKRKVFLINGNILFLENPSGKIYVFNNNDEDEDIEILKNYQKEYIIYSLNPISVLKGQSKFKEVSYDLKTIFDPRSYKNSKKRYNKITYPFKWLESNNFTVEKISDSSLSIIDKLHEKWVKYKMDQPQTYRIMFPPARYFRCCEKVLKETIQYEGFLFKLKDNPIAIRVVHVHNKTIYDMAFFSAFWEIPSQTTNYINSWCLKYFYDKEMETFNCGSSLNKNLKLFKEHYPFYIKESYMYSKQKQEKESIKKGFF
jgi:hypothetical protein